MKQKLQQIFPESAQRYPISLLQEYHELTDKKLRRMLTEAEAVRLREIRDEIAEIDSRRPSPDIWDIQEQKLREELEQLRNAVEALPDAPPTDK